MNAKSNKLQEPYSKQLAEFAEQLQKQRAEEDLLDYIHKALRDLLWDNQDVEADIRHILKEQHKAGHLRDETFELVQHKLDRMLTEGVDTAPKESGQEEQHASPFVDTTVIVTDTFDKAADSDRLQVGSVLRDRFLLQEEVAGGSMGVVYKALDRRLAEADGVDPSVAIKVLSPQLSRNGNALRALKQEAAKGRCLSHTNIVRFIDLDRDDDLYFIVFEWLDGRSLAAILDDSSSKTIDKDKALDIVGQLANALDYAHLRGVVHADVKPGNVMMSPLGEVKLCDFGIARVRQTQYDESAQFDPGVLGAVTPAYSSMQVLTGEEPVASDDVFSLACLMYRLVAGYRVFGPRNAAEAVEAGMEPQRPQGINDVEWAALRKALSYSRVSRFESARDFVDALASPTPVHVTQSAPISDEPDDERHWRWPSLLAALFLVAGAWGLYQSGLLDQISLGSLFDLSVDGRRKETTVPIPSLEPESSEESFAGGLDQSSDEESVMSMNADLSEPGAEGNRMDDLLDFSLLPPATIEIQLSSPGTVRTVRDLILRENEEPATIDLVRTTNLDDVLVVKLEEVSYSGNRSPWESGQYHISENSLARFRPGQERARITVSMTPDPLREPDREVSLLVRDFEDADSEFALVNLTLEDDDQRSFESGLGTNTVAFAVGQVSVRERDPAVQIDLVRFNPDQTTLTVAYTLREVTATEGADYFVPGTTSVQFGPGQRSARILIPLVQDSTPESDEAFVLEMSDPQGSATDANIFRRIAVMIRDDDSNF